MPISKELGLFFDRRERKDCKKTALSLLISKTLIPKYLQVITRECEAQKALSSQAHLDIVWLLSGAKTCVNLHNCV